MRKFFPAIGMELTNLDDTATYMPRKEEIVSFAIRNCNGIETGKVPEISVRVTHPENLLKYFNYQ